MLCVEASTARMRPSCSSSGQLLEAAEHLVGAELYREVRRPSWGGLQRAAVGGAELLEFGPLRVDALGSGGH